jgi:hypothetical protein
MSTAIDAAQRSTMTRAGLWVALIATVAVPSVAFAEGTVKSNDDCFQELSSIAGRGTTSIADRRGQRRPLVEDVDEMRLDPLDGADVQKVVREHLGEIEYCYDRLAARAKAPTGEVTLSLAIEPTGKVTSVSVAAPGVNVRSLKKCLSPQVKRWRFPATNVETQVEYPLVFDVVNAAR